MSDEGRQDTTDDVLVERMREGDERAFETLFDRHLRALSVRIRQILPPAVLRKVSVSDVIQEARITAFERARGFEPRHLGGLSGWSLKLAELKARSALRRFAGTAKRSVRREVSRGARPDTHALRGDGPTPSQVAVAAELNEIARRALLALPEDHREVILLARVEGLRMAEIATRMRRSPDAVKKLHARAMSLFTAIFEARMEERDV